MKKTTKLQDIVEIQRRGLARFLFEAEGNKEETEEVEPAEETPAEEANVEEVEEEKPEKPVDPVKTDNVKVAIDDLLMSAEEKALKSAAIEQAAEKAKGIGGVAESRRLHSIRPLYEEAGQLMPQIDIRVFAGEVARLARNYRFLLDMERLIVIQAKDYLTSKYDESAAEELEEILNDEYDIDIKRTPGKPEGKLNVPNAMGARQASA